MRLRSLVLIYMPLFIGALIHHEVEKKYKWIQEFLQFVYSNCCSVDPRQSELRSSIFATLTIVAPEEFVAHRRSISEMLAAALTDYETSGNMATQVTYKICTTMTYLVPFIFIHKTVELTDQKSIAMIIKFLQAFVVEDSLIRLFKLLEYPQLHSTNIRLLLDFHLEASKNTQLDSSVRVNTGIYWLVGALEEEGNCQARAR
ncbi:uncharacterized protein LOC129921418 [Episyrphus balteatus]|uniref:uncharacterized protein LOC129921418 n=1 Tax=Episyrphus balteatus TaxID=286459 RepID=UPI002486479A|nr:uncharacterized protein LOC129921418 [Episyrphus balteatus]